MKKKALAWMIFLASILFLSLAVTPYSRTADAALIAIRFTLVTVLSILMVRERWNKRHAVPGRPVLRNPGVGGEFLQRCRRWYRGEG